MYPAAAAVVVTASPVAASAEASLFSALRFWVAVKASNTRNGFCFCFSVHLYIIVVRQGLAITPVPSDVVGVAILQV